MTPHATSDPCDAVLDGIASVKHAIQVIDVCAYRRENPETLNELPKSIARVFEAVRALGSRLTDLSGEILEQAPERASSAGLLGARRSPSALDVADLAFLMRMSIDQSQIELEAAGTAASMLEICERYRGQLEQMLAALEQRFEGQPALGTRERGVEASLKCRRAYASLRDGLVDVGDVPRGRAGNIRGLRVAGALIARVIGSDGYTYFRVSDRLQLAELGGRMLDYLEHGGSAARGVRILQDFKAFVDQLAVVNLRQDLKRHDAGCLSDWLSELEGATAGGTKLMDSVSKYREAVRGRDAAFDALLEGRATLTRPGLITDLRRMLDSLAPHDEVSGERAPPANPARTSA